MAWRIIDVGDDDHGGALIDIRHAEAAIRRLQVARPAEGRAFAQALTKLDEARLWLTEAMRDRG